MLRKVALRRDDLDRRRQRHAGLPRRRRPVGAGADRLPAGDRARRRRHDLRRRRRQRPHPRARPEPAGPPARRVHDRLRRRALAVRLRSQRSPPAHASTRSPATEQLRFTYDAPRAADRHRSTATARRRRSSATRAGVPTAIVGPYGQTTTLQVSAGGYLSRIANPAGERILLEYDAGGLLTKLTDSRDGVHTFDYDALGRLTRDAAADGSAQTLTRSGRRRRHDGRRTPPAEGRTTTYRVERTADGVDPAHGHRRRRPQHRHRHRQRRRHHGHARRRHEGDAGDRARPALRHAVAGHDADDDHDAERRCARSSSGSGSAELADAGNALSLRSLTETTTSNGRTVTVALRVRRAAASSTARRPGAPADRDRRARAACVREVTPGVAPTTYSYDARGRLTGTVAGSRDRDLRATTTAAAWRRSPTRSRARPSSRYDLADRLTAIKRPGRAPGRLHLRRRRQPDHGHAARPRAAHVRVSTRATACSATRRRCWAALARRRRYSADRDDLTDRRQPPGRDHRRVRLRRRRARCSA